MRNFQKIAEGVDVVPLLDAIARQPDLWNKNRLRKDYPGSPHKDVDDIWVWFNEVGDDARAVADDRMVRPYDAWMKLPQLRPIIFGLMARVDGVQLGRVIISRLPPGKTIALHEDGGAPATWFTRYQVALTSPPVVTFRAGEEVVVFRSGEIWQCDNTQPHEVVNNSNDDRLAIVVDIRNG